MKILVIDDSSVHQQSARQTLKDHDLTVVGSYDEAVRLMGQDFKVGSKYGQVFDAVLTDLMLPAGMGGLGGAGSEFDGQEMPMGFGLALLAVLYSGAKMVAVVTDLNRHVHPASRLLDLLIGRHESPSVNSHGRPKFLMNGAVVGFYNSGHRKLQVTGSDGSIGKNWGAVLANLVGEPAPVG